MVITWSSPSPGQSCIRGKSTDSHLLQSTYQPTLPRCLRACSVRKVEAQQTGVGSPLAESDQMSHDVLMDRVALLFREADTDGNGTLSRAEFQQVGAVNYCTTPSVQETVWNLMQKLGCRPSVPKGCFCDDAIGHKIRERKSYSSFPCTGFEIEP